MDRFFIGLSCRDHHAPAETGPVCVAINLALAKPAERAVSGVPMNCTGKLHLKA
ncbi:hypothetical protein ACQR16_06645 [Bradyrhizobium oligotrophicum]|uniref:hypothetical protein n=1 Tax=Bradyrhizobium oligotrophicum TaxID=44255 RepID=UPI003EBFC246